MILNVNYSILHPKVSLNVNYSILHPKVSLNVIVFGVVGSAM